MDEYLSLLLNMSKLNILLLCSSRFALPTLKELAFFQMLAAVAIPVRCDEMVENVQVILQGSGIPVVLLEKETFVEQVVQIIDEHHVTLGLMMTFPYKIPSSVYNLPLKGFYNVHPGPLPAYRGADPVFQQIKNKEKQAGVTIHKLNEGIDTGPVVIHEMLKIETKDTYGMLTTKLANLAARLTGTLIKLVDFDLAIPSRPQNETSARYFKRQTADDITIDWQTMDAETIVALINACNPWNKGAVTKINNQVMRLLCAEKLPPHTVIGKSAGCIVALQDKGMVVSTIHDQAIIVNVIYMEEGFLNTGMLPLLGIESGHFFEKL